MTIAPLIMLVGQVSATQGLAWSHPRYSGVHQKPRLLHVISRTRGGKWESYSLSVMWKDPAVWINSISLYGEGPGLTPLDYLS